MSLEFVGGGASRAVSRDGAPGRKTIATGLDEILSVDLAAFAEPAVRYQRDFLAAASMTWLSKVPETAPLHRRLLGSLRWSPGDSQRRDDPAVARVHARARRATVPSAEALPEDCLVAPAAPGSRPIGSRTVSPPLMPRTGTGTAALPFMRAPLSSPRTVLGSSSAWWASAFSKRRRKGHRFRSLLVHLFAFKATLWFISGFLCQRRPGLGCSRAYHGAWSCTASAGRSRRGLRLLSTAFCCISERVSLVSCLALTRLVWRDHVFYGRRFRHLRVSFRAQCHRSAMQSIGEGNSCLPGERLGLCLRGHFFGGAHTMVLRTGAALAASSLETVV